MTDNAVIFRNLASSDMVRRAVQNHSKHQPIANDVGIDSLLSRLAGAKARAKRDEDLPTQSE
jgi:hypothetical protein